MVLSTSYNVDFSNQMELNVLRVGTHDEGVCSINLRIFSINKKKKKPSRPRGKVACESEGLGGEHDWH